MSAQPTLSQLYFSHIGELCSFLTRKLNCRETARELAHESFVRFMSQKNNVEIGNPRALLYRIAGNLAIDHYRMSQARRGLHVQLDDCIDLACDRPSPEHILQARQMVERLRLSIEALPPQCRRIFLLHKFEGLPHTEIAETYGITRNAVEKHLVRALVSLRHAMDVS